MDALLTHATVITLNGDNRVITDGAVAIQKDRVAAVGLSADLETKFPSLPHSDLHNRAILPGLINSHTHTVLTVLRGAIENGVGNRVYGYMVPITFSMSDDERRALAALGCLEAIRSGTTTLVDPLRFVPSYAGTMADTGLRLYLSESAADAVTTEIRTSGYRYERTLGEAFLERTVNLIDTYHNTRDGRVQCMVAAHAPDNCSPWMLDTLRELATSRGLRRTVHLAQSQQEVDQVKVITGDRTPTEYLLDHGWLASDVLVAHCTHCTESDIGLLAETGTSMAHCPASSSRRGHHGLANMPGLSDAGVNVTLGTDNMSEDMFEALRIGTIVNRGLRGDGQHPTPAEMLKWATTNACQALGRDDLGSLEPGKTADLTVIRLDRPHLTPILDVVSSLVHYGQASDVESVMVGGDWVMRDGIVLTMDEEATIEGAQQASINAWERLRARWPDIEVVPALERSKA
jgi:5-methylthioadenosine/S-adenosylhomocysteine deaminase